MNLQSVNSEVNYDLAGSHLVFVTIEKLSFSKLTLFFLFRCHIDTNTHSWGNILKLLMLSYLFFQRDQL